MNTSTIVDHMKNDISKETKEGCDLIQTAVLKYIENNERASL